MNKILLFICIICLSFSCTNPYYSTIIDNHEATFDTIDILQYDVQKLYVFSNGKNWGNKGVAVLKKDLNDTLFGFSFFGHHKDANRSTIYLSDSAFLIYNKKKKFKQNQANKHILGSPGGQMIYENIFKLDDDFANLHLYEIDDGRHVLIYEFEDIFDKDTLKRVKFLELDNKTMLPNNVMIVRHLRYGRTDTTKFIFSNFRINSQVKKSIAGCRKDLIKFEEIKPEKPKPSPLLGADLPQPDLIDLINESETAKLDSEKIILLDFWEYWCGWCIKSLPKVEKLHKKYASDLDIIGIVTEEPDIARKTVKDKEISFKNVIAKKDLLKSFGVNSFPRYFLIDKNGIIQKEYHRFSEEIEKDIKELINK